MNFATCINSLNAQRNGTDTANLTLDILKDPRSLQNLGSFIDSLGMSFDKATRPGGNISLVLDMGNQSILRVTPLHVEPPRPKDWKILQPLFALENEGFRVELFPKVQVLDQAYRQGMFTNHQVAEIIKKEIAAFGRQGQLLWDFKLNNFGLLPLGKTGHYAPVLLDAGAICSLKEMHGGKLGNDTHTNWDKFKNLGTLFRDLGIQEPDIDLNPMKYLLDMMALLKPFPLDYQKIQKDHWTRLGLAPQSQSSCVTVA